MIASISLPLLIGALGVLQNTLNRYFASGLGLAWVLLINGLVLLSCGAMFFIALRFIPPEQLPAMYRPVQGARQIQMYDVLPGLFGFIIIAAMPWIIERLGATRVFIGVIAAQLVVSMLWDKYVDSQSLGAWRILGGALALAGAALASL